MAQTKSTARAKLLLGEDSYSVSIHTLDQLEKNAQPGVISWINSSTCVIDANQALFPSILEHLRTKSFPLFWTQASGYDLAKYNALLQEAKIFGLKPLVDWISAKTFLRAIAIHDKVQLISDFTRAIGNLCMPPGVDDHHIHPHWRIMRTFECPRGIDGHDDDPVLCGYTCMEGESTADCYYDRLVCDLLVCTKKYDVDFEVLSEQKGEAAGEVKEELTA